MKMVFDMWVWFTKVSFSQLFFFKFLGAFLTLFLTAESALVLLLPPTPFAATWTQGGRLALTEVPAGSALWPSLMVFKIFNVVFFKQEKSALLSLCLRTQIRVLSPVLLVIIFMPAKRPVMVAMLCLEFWHTPNYSTPWCKLQRW